MIRGRRQFRPAAWSVALTGVGVVLFLVLGNWQLERAAFKESVRSTYEQRLALDYQGLDLSLARADMEYRKLRLRGRFDNAHSFLLDNQVYQGQAGYHVLTPLQLADSDRVILVNRGWAAWGPSREAAPDIPAPIDAQSVTGIASFPSEPTLQLGRHEFSAQWPQLITWIDIESLRVQYSNRLLPFVLWQAPEQPGHFVREWNPLWLPPEKSRAYALQWFLFAVLAIVLFIVLNLRKIE